MSGFKEVGVVHHWSHGWIDVFNYKKEDVNMNAIADTLSKLCRWGGKCSHFYSVAQHSLWLACFVLGAGDQHVVRSASIEGVNSKEELALLLLLHDAAEAIIGDWARPLKATAFLVNPKTGEQCTFDDLEQQILRVIFEANNLPWPSGAAWKAVAELDNGALATEAHYLMGGLALPGLPPPAPWPLRLDCTPEQDRSEFMMLFLDLMRRIKA